MTIIYAWTAIAVLSALVQLWSTFDAAFSLRATYLLQKNGARREYGRWQVRAGVCLLFVHSLFVIAGASAWAEGVEPKSNARVFIFMTASVVLLFVGLDGRRVTHSLRSRYERKESP